MQHFLEPHVEKDTWLTAFLNLPVEEEVTIKGGSKKIIYICIYSANYTSTISATNAKSEKECHSNAGNA